MLLKILTTAALLLSLFLLLKLSKRILNRIAERKEVSHKRVFYIEKVFDFFFILVVLFTSALIWSVDFKGVSVIASSVFAVIGVALFAQ